jgi:hypothetical protein
VQLGNSYLRELRGGSHDQRRSDATKEKINRFQSLEKFVRHALKVETSEYPPVLLKKEDGVFKNVVKWSVVRNFLSFYLHHFGGLSITQSQWKKALDALQDWTNCNLTGLGCKPEKGLIIRCNHVVQNLSSSINSGKNNLKDEQNVDLHSDLLWTVTPKQKLSFIDQCYLPTTETTSKMDGLTGLQVLRVGFAMSSCTMQRSEYIHGLRYKFSLTCELEEWD